MIDREKLEELMKKLEEKIILECEKTQDASFVHYYPPLNKAIEKRTKQNKT